MYVGIRPTSLRNPSATVVECLRFETLLRTSPPYLMITCWNRTRGKRCGRVGVYHTNRLIYPGLSGWLNGNEAMKRAHNNAGNGGVHFVCTIYLVQQRHGHIEKGERDPRTGWLNTTTLFKTPCQQSVVCRLCPRFGLYRGSSGWPINNNRQDFESFFGAFSLLCPPLLLFLCCCCHYERPTWWWWRTTSSHHHRRRRRLRRRPVNRAFLLHTFKNPTVRCYSNAIRPCGWVRVCQSKHTHTHTDATSGGTEAWKNLLSLRFLKVFIRPKRKTDRFCTF